MSLFDTYKTSDDRSIHVLDNAFPKAYQESLYNQIVGATYSIGFADTSAIERANHKYLHHPLDPSGVEAIGIFSTLEKASIYQLIEGKQLTRATINLSVPSDTNFPHTHRGEWSLLYYINLDWNPEWSGETMFYDDALSKVEYTSLYTPNRLIVFDGDIPHAIRPQAVTAPHYRFTLAMFFEK